MTADGVNQSFKNPAKSEDSSLIRTLAQKRSKVGIGEWRYGVCSATNKLNRLWFPKSERTFGGMPGRELDRPCAMVDRGDVPLCLPPRVATLTGEQ